MHSNVNPATIDHATGSDDSAKAASNESHGMGLYVFPALLVLVFVLGWLFVFWLLHEDQDVQSLVQGLQQPGRRSWQKAYALSFTLQDATKTLTDKIIDKTMTKLMGAFERELDAHIRK